MAADDEQLLEQLSRPALYRDDKRAFSASTGVPLTLRPDQAPLASARGQHRCSESNQMIVAQWQNAEPQAVTRAHA